MNPFNESHYDGKDVNMQKPKYTLIELKKTSTLHIIIFEMDCAYCIVIIQDLFIMFCSVEVTEIFHF